MATFETVATFNDKKNNNNKVTVNIAMQPLKKKMKQALSPSSSSCVESPLIAAATAAAVTTKTVATSKAPHMPLSSSSASPASPPPPQPVHLRVDKATLTDPEDDEDAARQKQKQKGGAGSSTSLAMAGRLHSVIQSLKSVFHWTTHSISGGMKNSESFLLDNGSRRRGYNPLTCDNNNVEAGASVTSASVASEDNWSNEWAPSSHLPSPISEMDEDSDHSWDDEELTCNVCDRAFTSPRKLEYHQHKKRHWGCNSCDSLFSTLMSLEHHKDIYEHWSDDDFDSDDDDDDDFELYDLDEEYIESLRRSHSDFVSRRQGSGNYHDRAVLLM